MRELNQAGLGDSQTWYNNTVVYTHGYGLVAAYGNQRSADGQPVFLESGIPTTGDLGKFEPRIYFGENSPEYSIVGGAQGDHADRTGLPRGHQGRGADLFDVLRQRRAEARQRLQEADLRDQVPVRSRSSSPTRSTTTRRSSTTATPLDRVQKVAPYLTLDSDTVPGGRRRPRRLDRRRLHHERELPVLQDRAALERDRGHLHALPPRTRSTTSTTSATRSRPPSTPTTAGHALRLGRQGPGAEDLAEDLPVDGQADERHERPADEPRALPGRPVQGAARDPRFVPRDGRRLVLLERRPVGHAERPGARRPREQRRSRRTT